MPLLSLTPTSGTPRSRASQYTVDLYHGDYAIITFVERAWVMTVHPSGRPPVDRGAFGSPEDAVAVLEAEVTARLVHEAARAAKATRQQPQATNQPSSGSDHPR